MFIQAEVEADLNVKPSERGVLRKDLSNISIQELQSPARVMSITCD